MTSVDIVDTALRATFSGAPWAPLLAAAAGVATSVGPCAAPRWLTISALAEGGAVGRWRCAAYASGIVLAYTCMGSTASLLLQLASASHVLYGGMALAMGVGGLRAIALAHEKGCGDAHACGSIPTATVAGIASGLVVSPCCTPLLAAAATAALSSGNIAHGAVVAACFGAGHIAPVLCLGGIVRRIERALSSRGMRQAPVFVGGAVMLGSALYYGLLA